MNYKRIGCLLLIAILTAGVVFAGGQTEQVSKDKVQIRVAISTKPVEDTFDPVTNTTKLGYHTVIEKFNAAHDDIEIVPIFVPAENALTKIQTLFMGKEVDVVYSGATDKLWVQDFLLDLSTIPEAEQFMQDVISPSAQIGERIRIGDALIGIPIYFSPIFTMYDKQIFDDFGVPYPSEYPTAEEILEIIPKVSGTNPRTGKETYGLWFRSWEANYITDVLNDGLFYMKNHDDIMGPLQFDYSQADFQFYTEENVDKIMNFLSIIPYVPKGLPSGSGKEKWGTEDNDVAMIVRAQASETFPPIANELEDRFVAIPGLFDKQGRKAYLSIDTVGIAKDCADVDAAWKVVEYLAGYEVAKFAYEEHQAYSVLKEDMIDFIDDSGYSQTISKGIGSPRHLGFPAFYILNYRNAFLNKLRDTIISGGTVTRADVVAGLKQLDIDGKVWAENF